MVRKDLRIEKRKDCCNHFQDIELWGLTIIDKDGEETFVCECCLRNVIVKIQDLSYMTKDGAKDGEPCF